MSGVTSAVNGRIDKTITPIVPSYGTVLATIKVAMQQRRHPSGDDTDRDLREDSNMQGGDTHRFAALLGQLVDR